MSETVQPRRSPRRLRRGVAAGAALALIGAAFAARQGPEPGAASSHREAPIIAGDPRADNTDVYAFVSPDDPNTVTIISNWIPFEEPNGGPNFYDWDTTATNTSYTIKIDNDGDAVPDLTYRWAFTTRIRNAASQSLYNTGVVTSLNDPDLNVYQTYDLTVTTSGGTTLLLDDQQAAPSIVGPASTPDYSVLRNQATVNLPGGGKNYVGQADDPFFLDLRVFDLLYGGNLSEVGQDTLAGYNVNTIVLQLPKSVLALANNATRNPVIGIWSTTERNGTQISRLGNPLVNEVVMPLALKDAFNGLRPQDDASTAPAVAAVTNPILPGVVQAVYGIPAPPTPRNDLVEVFLTGIYNGSPGPVQADLNSQRINQDANVANFRPSEMLRLNMNVPLAASPQRLAALAGDFQGFPNGRRLSDDVIDIALQVVEGALISGPVAALAKGDNVDRNDHAFTNTFPYLALPNVPAVNTGPDRAPRDPELVAINPQRVLETRTDQGGQIGYSGPKPAAGSFIKVPVVGVAGVPAGTKSVLLNVTAVNASADGYVSVGACSGTPGFSNVNFAVGTVKQNLVSAPVENDGTVCIYTYAATDLIADLAGYRPPTSSHVRTQPQRVLETRSGGGITQIGYSGPKPADGQTITLALTGVGTPPVGANAKAAFLNVTTVNSEADGFVTVFPCGAPRPNASNVNAVTDAVRTNLAVGMLSASGTVCLYTSKATDVIVDLQGYEPATSNFVPLMPERVLETRTGGGISQVGYSGAKPIAGQTVEVKITGFGASQVPDDAASVLLNVTAVGASGAGFATVFPCGSPRPLASNLNYGTGTDIITNMVSAKIGDGGRVCIYTSAPTDLVVDLNGYYPDAS